MEDLENAVVEVLSNRFQVKACHVAREISRHLRDAFIRRGKSLASFLCTQTVVSLKNPLSLVKESAFLRLMATRWGLGFKTQMLLYHLR